MIRKLVVRFTESLRGYLSSSSKASSPPRRKICVPLTISIVPETMGVRRKETGKLVMSENATAAMLSVKGETSDLSESGLAFIVSSVRLGQHYLVGAEGRTLNVVLDLPTGKVCFQAVGKRHEPLGAGASATKYLIGAQITKMSDADRRSYAEYLTHGWKTHKSESKGLAFGATKS